MTTRVLVSDNGVVQVYNVLNDQGQQIGIDVVEIPTTADIDLAALQTKATQALTGNSTYLGLSSPTTAQAVAQVAALTRQMNALIRLQLNLLDSTSGT